MIRRLTGYGLALGFIAAALACTALPDVSPFASATAELAAAVKTSGKAVEGEIRRMENGQAKADKLREDWDKRVELMTATVRYADSLVAIVQATKDSRESARQLADKLGGLATAVGFSAPGAALSVATDAASFVWAQIALARGAASLTEALEHAQPAIERIAEKIAEDLASLDLASQGAAQNLEGAIIADPAFREARDTEKAALAAKQAVLAKLRGASDPAALAGMTAELGQLDQAERVLAAARGTLEPGRRAIAEARERERVARELIGAASAALSDWAIAHKDLVFAVRERRPVDVGSISAAVVEIRGLIRRAKEL